MERCARSKVPWVLVLALFVAACGTGPKKAEAPSGKYYLDDGPPDSVPDNLAHVPDAVPRDEPFHRFANRPYTVFGQTYVPVVDKEPSKQRGLASWYGKKFHGQKTSSGEVYDMFAMTAAHKTFPIPSYARVTNVKSGLSVVVRVNDRGPFHPGRIIDLSYAAAAKIGIVAAGSAMVEVERVFDAAGSVSARATLAAAPPQATAIETPVLAQEPAGLWIQLGAFSSADGAESFREHVTRELDWMREPVHVFSRDGMHRVRLGPYRNREEAAAIAEKVARSMGNVTPAIR
jgi:peptidoglycan lytic transglycosylase